jgi:hypothetical protein
MTDKGLPVFCLLHELVCRGVGAPSTNPAPGTNGSFLSVNAV